MVEQLNQIGGRNGVGRIDIVENRFVGMKSRGVYEAPGMTLLYAAALQLEQLTLDRDLTHLRDRLSPKSPKWSTMVLVLRQDGRLDVVHSKVA